MTYLAQLDDFCQETGILRQKEALKIKLTNYYSALKLLTGLMIAVFIE
jgi:hypothetical protein